MLNWDLESLFSNQNSFSSIKKFLEKLNFEYNVFSDYIDKINKLQIDENEIIELITKEQLLFSKLASINSFLECCSYSNKSESELNKFKIYSTKLYLKKVETSLFMDYIINNFNEQKLNHNNRKIFKRRKTSISSNITLSPSKTNLLNMFFTSDLNSWEDMYFKLLTYTNNEIASYKEVFKQPKFNDIMTIFKKKEELFATILNNFIGHRLNIYKNFNKNSVLDESLCLYNKMEESTLFNMLNILEENIYKLHDYCKFKKKYLNLSEITWDQLYSPLVTNTKKLEVEEVIELIRIVLQEFDDEFLEFFNSYISNKCILIDNNIKKKKTAVTINFSFLKQSRIYINSSNDDLTLNLAHELGHAYHFYKLNNLPFLYQDYSLAISESVAMFIELLVSEKLISNSNSINEKIYFLSQKIQNNSMFLLDIYSKFLFEYEIYSERRKNIFTGKEFRKLMERYQKRIFGLEETLNPFIWCSNSHFYKSSVPFYNYPYIFGCIVSNFFLSEYKKNPVVFLINFKKLLLKSGSQNIEELFWETFHINLESKEIWNEGINMIYKDIYYLISLINKI